MREGGGFIIIRDTDLLLSRMQGMTWLLYEDLCIIILITFDIYVQDFDAWRCCIFGSGRCLRNNGAYLVYMLPLLKM